MVIETINGRALKLTIELVPMPLHYKSIRSAVSGGKWNYIRKKVYKSANWTCQTCGASDKQVHAHEIWKYDDAKHIQKLVGFICLCPDCHLVKHMGFANTQGRHDEAFGHFIKVNKLSIEEAKEIEDETWKLWTERSNNKWFQDISYVKEFTKNM